MKNKSYVNMIFASYSFYKMPYKCIIYVLILCNTVSIHNYNVLSWYKTISFKQNIHSLKTIYKAIKHNLELHRKTTSSFNCVNRVKSYTLCIKHFKSYYYYYFFLEFKRFWNFHYHFWQYFCFKREHLIFFKNIIYTITN